MKEKIGILGGTFDPIHNGHLAIAKYAIDLCGLERVILVPTGTPPHKAVKGVMAPTHRYNMAKLATEDYHNIDVSDVEIVRDGYSYTYDTINELKNKMPDVLMHYIIGADNLLTIKAWKNAKELLKGIHIICFSREGYDMKMAMDELINDYGAQITTLSISNIIISSSLIREMLAEGEDIHQFVCEKVREYIKLNQLYPCEGE